MVFGRFGGDKRLEAQKVALNEFVEQFEAIQQRVNDLGPIRAQFADVWPSEGVPAELVSEIEKARNLSGMLVQRASTARRELEQFERGVADIRGALDVYRNLLNDHALLPDVSTASLMDIIGMMQNSILKIEDCRVDLATHIAMSAAMRNSGLTGT